jgi:hypothetical protein
MDIAVYTSNCDSVRRRDGKEPFADQSQGLEG